MMMRRVTVLRGMRDAEELCRQEKYRNDTPDGRAAASLQQIERTHRFSTLGMS